MRVRSKVASFWISVAVGPPAATLTMLAIFVRPFLRWPTGESGSNPVGYLILFYGIGIIPVLISTGISLLWVQPDGTLSLSAVLVPALGTAAVASLVFGPLFPLLILPFLLAALVASFISLAVALLFGAMSL